ncbi:MAG: nuclear transport factor 2 family protein [Amylibacter sp.]
MTVNISDCNKFVEEHFKAWNRFTPEKVAESYTIDACFTINRGEPMNGRIEIATMVSGFMSEFPDMVLKCETVMIADHHMVYGWTFEGHHKETKKFVSIKGWEEWDFDENMKVKSSLGWYDAQEYERQVAEGV